MLNVNLGVIEQPEATQGFGVDPGNAIGSLLNLFFNLILIVAGIFALFNFILAGYMFLSAGDDPKKVEGAWSKIYMSVIGLLVAGGSLVLAAIFGQIIFGDPTFLISPVIPVPQ